MPVTRCKQQQQTLYQRNQYAKGGMGRWHWDRRDQLTLDLVRPTDRTIVDIGCGEGITLEKTHRLYPDRNVLGIDNLPENIDICKNHRCKAELGDVYDLPFSSESVDCVLFMEVIEHLKDPATAVKEIHRVLVPRGRLVLAFPNDRFFKIARILFLRWHEAVYDPGHVRQWTPKDMRHFLSRQHFTLAFSRNIPFLFWPISLHCVMAADKK